MKADSKDISRAELEGNSIFKGHNTAEKILIKVLAISWGIFQIYTAARGTLAPLQQRGTYLFFTLILTFLIYNYGSSKSWIKKISYLLVLIFFSVSFYSIIPNPPILY